MGLPPPPPPRWGSVPGLSHPQGERCFFSLKSHQNFPCCNLCLLPCLLSLRGEGVLHTFAPSGCFVAWGYSIPGRILRGGNVAERSSAAHGCLWQPELCGALGYQGPTLLPRAGEAFSTRKITPRSPGAGLGASRLSRLDESSWGPRAPAPQHLPALNKSGLTTPLSALLPCLSGPWLYAVSVTPLCSPGAASLSPCSAPALGRAGAPDGRSNPEELMLSRHTPHPAPPRALRAALARGLCL